MHELILLLLLLIPPSNHPITAQQNSEVIDCQARGTPRLVGNGTGIGIEVRNKTGVVIQNCVVTGFELGLLVENSSNVIIRNSEFSNNYVDDDSILDLGGWFPKGGVLLHNVTNSVVQNVTSTGNTAAIQVFGGGGNTLRANNASHNRGWGIRLVASPGNRVEDNIASYNNRSCPEWGHNAGCESAGIVLVNSDFTMVVGNIANASGDGIYQGNTPERASHNSAFYWNTLNENSANGVEATFSHDNRFIGNELQNNNYGFWLGYSSWTLVSGNFTFGSRTMDCSAEHSNNIVLDGNTFTTCPP